MTIVELVTGPNRSEFTITWEQMATFSVNAMTAVYIFVQQVRSKSLDYLKTRRGTYTILIALKSCLDDVPMYYS